MQTEKSTSHLHKNVETFGSAHESPSEEPSSGTVSVYRPGILRNMP